MSPSWVAVSATFLLSVLVGTPAMAGDPTAAVSGTTASVYGVGGSSGGEGVGAGGASLSFPITHSIGGQIDTALSNADGTYGGEAGLHLFTRDPEAYLAGVTFDYNRFSSNNSYRYGLEGEAYLNDFTVGLIGGVQRGGANRGTTTSGFAAVQGDYYATDTIKLSVSFGGYSGYRAALGEVQWQPLQDLPFVVFADAGANVAVDHHGLFLAGIRYSFGAPNTTIKERDRHGDPTPFLFNGMTSSNLIGNTKALDNPPAGAPAPQPAPPAPPV